MSFINHYMNKKLIEISNMPPLNSKEKMEKSALI